MSRHGRRPLRDACEAGAFRGLLAAFRALPYPASMALGRLVGRLVGEADRAHLRRAEGQIAASLGPEGALAAARAMYAHVGMCVAEMAWIEGRAARGEIGEWVRIEGMEHVKAGLEKGRGLAIVSGHLGNWELGAVAMAAVGIPISVVARPLDNPHLDRMLNRIRGAGGSEVLSKRNALRAMREVLARNRAIAILIDQDAREHGVFVDFFGRPASTIPSIAAICLRTGAPMVVTAMRRSPDRLTHTLSFEPVEIPSPSGDSKEDAKRLTALLTSMLEARIREAPEQWLWMHRRWKNQPTGK